MISLHDLTKSYGTACAVNGLSLDVAAGEIVGLIGPNGAGKTSTLRCIAGIHRPTSGTVAIGGHDIVRDPIEAKRRIAFVVPIAAIVVAVNALWIVRTDSAFEEAATDAADRMSQATAAAPWPGRWPCLPDRHCCAWICGRSLPTWC